MALRPGAALAALILLATSPRTATAQSRFPPGPGPYDPAVPTIAAIRGFATGERFSTHADVERVLTGIAEASERVQLERYGESTEGRGLHLAWISSPENLSRLDAIRAENRRLFADPGGADPPTDAPVIVWLSFGVHGDEAAAPEAALELLYHLAASDDSETVDRLGRSVVVIDPLLNPDGHERYVVWHRSTVGVGPSPSPGAREHRPPWAAGRTNHWYFDLNRDWAWGVMPETRARRAAYLATLPHVHVDFHEMEAESSYFFFPAAAPVHPLYPPSTLRWSEAFGAGNARAFDLRGWPYYSAEDFDLFYPGYGDSWPSFYGATGMTYEQAGGGRAGLAFERADGSVLTLADRVEHHVVAALATLETAVRWREERLADFAAFWTRPTRLAPGVPGVYYVPRDRPDGGRLVELLHVQGVRVDTLAAPLDGDGLIGYPGLPAPPDTLPPGTWTIPGDQPLGRYLAALMAPAPALPDTVLFYDITGWTLPYLYDVAAWHASAEPAVPTGRWAPSDEGPETGSTVGSVAFAWAYAGVDDVIAAARLAGAGVRVRVSDRTFAAEGRAFARGDFVTRVADQPDSLATADALLGALRSAGVRAHRMTSAGTTSGIDLGSDRLRLVRAPRVAIATGPGTHPPSVGAAWHLLAVRAGVPTDLVRLSDLAADPGADADSLAGLHAAPLALDGYTTLILPDGPEAAAYAAVLGESGRRRIVEWVDGGGTVIGIRAAAAWLSADHAGVAVAPLADPVEPTDLERLAPEAVRERREILERIPGTLLAVEVDTTHPLGYGFGERAAVLARDPVEFALSDEGNPWVYADAEPLAGYLPPAARRRLPGTPYALSEARGQGWVVLFADDPGFRGMVEGLNKLYLNAIVLLSGR